MRRITALFLSVLMIAASLSLLAGAADIGKTDNAYAPVGTAIATAEDFAAMAADGQYYLTADITVSASYASTFTGTFDGNGHTVTLSAPLFIHLNGATVKNLTVEGSITSSVLTAKDTHGYGANASGAIAAVANGDTTVQNILNNASVMPVYPANGVNSFFGGLVGMTVGASNFKFIDCKNTGKVSADYAEKNIACGGIVGLTPEKVASVRFESCVNTGEIYAKSGVNTAAVGGIAAWVHDHTALAEFDKCENYGKISAYSGSKGGTTRIGGMVGYITAYKATFNDCHNHGDVTADADTQVNPCIGGMVGYAAYAAGKTEVVLEFTGCTNTFDLKYSGNGPFKSVFLAGIMAYSKLACNFTDCINYGDITSDYIGTEDISKKEYDAAGIADVLGANGIDCHSTFKNCINLGNITSDGYRAAGIDAYAYGTASAYPVFDGCIVICDSITGQYAGGLAAYFNTNGVVAKNNYIAVPTISSSTDEHKANAFFWDNKCAPKEGNVAGNIVISNTKYLMAAGSNWETVAWSDSTPGVELANAGALATVPAEADVKSGKVAYEYNQAVGATVLYQDLANGGLPTVEADEDHVVMFENGAYTNPVKSDVTEPGEAPSGGDSAYIFMALALVSVIGVAAVAKKREN